MELTGWKPAARPQCSPMAEMQIRMYRNDSDQMYDIPGLGEIYSDQRISIHTEFPPAINLQNYPGLVDVLEEEKAGNGRDYEQNPEAPIDPTAPGGDLQSSRKGPASANEEQN